MQKHIIKISEKNIALFSLFLFVFSIIPLLMLGRYNVMGADDYSYGIDVHDTWLSTGSFWQSVKAAAEHTKAIFFIWQGTYASCFLMSMCPMHFKFELSCIVPFIMIGMFSASTFLIGWQIFVRWLGGNKLLYTYIGCMLLFLFWQVIDTPYDGIYWYNGATHYVLMESFAFLMFAAVSAIIWTDSKRNTIIWCVLASADGLIVGGGNLVTGLQAEIILVLLLIYTFIKAREKALYIFIPWLSFSLGFAVNILAPGNTARGGNFEAGYSAIVSIILSFYNALIYIGKWTSIMVILVWIAVLPAIWKLGSKSQQKFKHPIFVTVGVYCIVSAMFTPTLYALGETGLSRVNNIIQMTYYIGLFSATAFWIGWFTHRDKYIQKRKESECIETKYDLYGKMTTIIVLIMVVAVWIFTINKNTYTGISALRSIVKGDARIFYEEEMERREMYLNENMPDVIVEVHTVRPYLFEDRDLSWNPDYWINQSMTHYFHKNSIVRRVE